MSDENPERDCLKHSRLKRNCAECARDAEEAEATAERDALRARVAELEAKSRGDMHSPQCSSEFLSWLEGVLPEWGCSCGLDTTIDTLRAEVERLHAEVAESRGPSGATAAALERAAVALKAEADVVRARVAELEAEKADDWRTEADGNGVRWLSEAQHRSALESLRARCAGVAYATAESDADSYTMAPAIKAAVDAVPLEEP